jgi:predicted pyridoxine 5'-phosphate oxidase superfamily flavin-nucleotide-binding protein
VRAQAERVGGIIGDTIPAAAARFLAARAYLIVATVAEDGSVAASILCGAEGFAAATDERTVRITPLCGHIDSVMRDIRASGRVGILAIDPANRRRIRVNGQASVLDGTIFVTTREVYSNCPQYIHPRAVERRPMLPVHAVAGDVLTSEQQAWVTRADTFFIATAHRDTGADASHRGGDAGFVRVVNATRLLIPDYPGNNMFNTLGNLAADPRCGLLFVDPATGSTLQLRGRAAVLWEPERRIQVDVDSVIETRDAVPLRWL